MSNILAKLGAATRTEAAVKAHELGLIGLHRAVTPRQRGSPLMTEVPR